MRITTVEQLKWMKDLIGEEHFNGLKEHLEFGSKVWIFTSQKELEEERDLKEEERQYCCKRFSAGKTWTGIVRHSHKYHIEPYIYCGGNMGKSFTGTPTYLFVNN